MGVLVYGIFNSYDEAFFASARLKKSVRNITDTVIRETRRHAENSAETANRYVLPSGWPMNAGSGPMGGFFNMGVSLSYDANTEGVKTGKGEVMLQVETPDSQTAKQVSRRMLNLGGRSIRSVMH